MENNSSIGGSIEPIPTPSNPAAAEPRVEASTEAAQPDPTPLAVVVQPVSPTLIPQCDGLSAQQRIALAALVSGETFVAAAQAAGVSGPTLYRWRKHDPAFVAALNAWRSQAQDAVRDRLLAMADRAARTVLGAMDRGDAKLAMALLKGLGAIVPASPGPATASAARREMDREKLQEQVNAHRSRAALCEDTRRLAGEIHDYYAWKKNPSEIEARQAARHAHALAELEMLMEDGGGG